MRYLNAIVAVIALFAAGCAGLQQASPPIDKAAYNDTVSKRATAIREVGEFELVAKNAAGDVLWSEVAHNNLADEGEQLFLDITLRGATPPANWTLRLFNDTPIETDTIATLTGEPSGNGYAAATIERSNVGWPTLALNSGDYQATSKTVTFTASGGSIGPVTYAVLSDSNNKLISYAALSQTRTLAAGESLSITYKVKLQ